MQQLRQGLPAGQRRGIAVTAGGPPDECVSRRHAQLRRRYGQYVLYDWNSTGGTTVNGHPADETPLRHGDVLAFAGVKLRFEQLDADPPAPEPNPPPESRASATDPDTTRVKSDRGGSAP